MCVCVFECVCEAHIYCSDGTCKQRRGFSESSIKKFELVNLKSYFLFPALSSEQGFANAEARASDYRPLWELREGGGLGCRAVGQGSFVGSVLWHSFQS